MSFLTPAVFEALVAIVIVIGLIAAIARIIADFRSGPRWPEQVSPLEETEAQVADQGDDQAAYQAEQPAQADTIEEETTND